MSAKMMELLKGCSKCEYEESDGMLFRHCAECQLAITTEAYQYFMQGVSSPPDFDNGLTAAETEMLVITMEECGEVVQACSKILRHGIDSRYRDGTANRSALVGECGDVVACLAVLAHNGIIDRADLNANAEQKLAALKVQPNDRVHHIKPHQMP